LLLSGEKFLSANHIAETQSVVGTPESFGYFSTMTQHFLAISVLNNACSKLWIFNGAQGISQMSPDPLCVGWVWARDYPWSASHCHMYMWLNVTC